MSLAADLDWGSVPAWAGSLLTGTSLVIAAAAYRRSVLDKQREQAGRVSAWFDVAEGEHRLFVRNGSEAVVYDVVVRARTLEQELDLRSIPPLQTVSSILHQGTLTRSLPTVRFRDSAGRYWMRDEEGCLIAYGGPELSLDAARKYENFQK